MPDEDERDKYISKVREESWQNYLKRVEPERRYLFRKKIEAEEELFAGLPLTDFEVARHQVLAGIADVVEDRDLHPAISASYLLPGSADAGHAKVDPEYPAASKYLAQRSDNWELSQSMRAGVCTVPVPKPGANELYSRTLLQREAASQSQSAALLAEKVKREAIEQTRRSLPVFAYKEQILSAVKDYPVLILVGETGSGKTTQIPQYLVEAGYCEAKKKISCTQPRRVAAMSVAARVAEEMRVRLGHEVGYSVRFEDCTSEDTKVKYMTDGMLLREFIKSPDLNDYSVIIIDEAHERSLHTDILLGLIKDVSKFRTDLKIIISSATLDAEKFSDYFHGAPIFTVPGRRYEVDILYTKEPQPDYIKSVIKTCIQIHLTPVEGDILVFLTGQDEIEVVEGALQQFRRGYGKKMKDLLVAPIYASLPTELQARIFAPTPPDCRKIVLATNIAETSITIDGIVFVIDPGFVKLNTFNPRAGMESLIVTPCSKASANQRAGRAGRVSSGKCFRLYTAWTYENEMESSTPPEIQRSNLGNVLLLLKTIGIDDILNFDFLDPPHPDIIIRALEELYLLGALNESGHLTAIGRRMSELPLDPMMSRTILSADKYGCSEEVVSIVAMLSIQTVLFPKVSGEKGTSESRRHVFLQSEGDHLLLLDVWEQWRDSGFSSSWCRDHFLQYKTLRRARDVREQVARICEQMGMKLKSDHDGVKIKKSFLGGYFLHTARSQKAPGSYQTLMASQTVFIHPSSCLYQEDHEWVVYHELVCTSKEYMRHVTNIRPEWLLEAAPHFAKIHKITICK